MSVMDCESGGQTGDADDFDSTTDGGRKEKSLSLLCQSFLRHVAEQASLGNEIHMETVAKMLGVEKRRVYDIVNVMEALEAMQRSHKSYYKWRGLQHLPRLLHQLKTEAESDHLPEWVETVERAMCNFTSLSTTNSSAGHSSQSHDSGIFGCSQDESGCSASPMCHAPCARVPSMLYKTANRNTLSHLCRRFLMVLLSHSANGRRVSLDVASTILIKNAETEGFEPPSRSRCRRLYDIANVLVALGLINKMHYMFGTKKIPLFVYCGPEPDAEASLSTPLSVMLPDLGRSLSSSRQSLTTATAADSTAENSSLCSDSDGPIDLTSHNRVSKPVAKKPEPTKQRRARTPDENRPPAVAHGGPRRPQARRALVQQSQTQTQRGPRPAHDAKPTTTAITPPEKYTAGRRPLLHSTPVASSGGLQPLSLGSLSAFTPIAHSPLTPIENTHAGPLFASPLLPHLSMMRPLKRSVDQATQFNTAKRRELAPSSAYAQVSSVLNSMNM